MRVLIEDVIVGDVNTIAGFVEHIRDKKSICFIVIKDISSKMQVTVDKERLQDIVDILKKISVGSVIEINGLVQKSDYVKLNGIEMLPQSIKILSVADPSPIVSPNGTEAGIDTRLDYRWLDLRSDKNTLMFKVQSEFIRGCRDFLYRNHFVEIHTPKLIGSESESGAGVFKVDYFDNYAYLAQSPQFYKQMAMAAGFERIFESGPVFRAEKFSSRKHATEFSGFDIEFSYIDSVEDVMSLEEDMLIYAIQDISQKLKDRVKELYNIDIITPEKPFPRINLHDLYIELKERYGYTAPEYEQNDLTTEGERLCQKLSIDKYDHEFLFITGYPKDKRAFYHMRDNNDVPCGYDLIWKGCEITTGAQREHRYDILKRQAEEKGLAHDVKFYLEFFKYGCPPHGGFGIGIDRITMLMFNSNIKESMFIFRGPDRLTP